MADMFFHLAGNEFNLTPYEGPAQDGLVLITTKTDKVAQDLLDQVRMMGSNP